MNEFMLSLSHNPYDPWEEYDLWSSFDRREGFDTAGLLARVVSLSDAMSHADQDRVVEEAIDSIVQNPSFKGLYKKVRRS